MGFDTLIAFIFSLTLSMLVILKALLIRQKQMILMF
mgnify:CR=1 FL=1